MIKYVTGDLFESIKPQTFICHIVNNKVAMGSGFVVPLCKKYPKVKQRYTEVGQSLFLGDIDLIEVDKDNYIYVVNMYAQDGFSNYQGKKNVRPLNYGALSECLSQLSSEVLHWECQTNHDINIVMPLIGSGLAGGDFNIIEELIEWYLAPYNVTIYQLPGQEIR